MGQGRNAWNDKGWQERKKERFKGSVLEVLVSRRERALRTLLYPQGFGLLCFWLVLRVCLLFSYYSTIDLVNLFRIAIILGFTIPRVPSFSFNESNPLVNATGPFATAVPTIFSRAPTNFSFPAFASLQIDTSSNFLPIRFTHLSAAVYDLDSNLQVGSGNYAHRTLPAQSFPSILLPLNFTYVTSNSSDQTCQCSRFIMIVRNLPSSLIIQGQIGTMLAETRSFLPMVYAHVSTPPSRVIFRRLRDIVSALKFRLVLDMVIQGLPGQHATSAQISDASCPVVLPANAP